MESKMSKDLQETTHHLAIQAMLKQVLSPNPYAAMRKVLQDPQIEYRYHGKLVARKSLNGGLESANDDDVYLLARILAA